MGARHGSESVDVGGCAAPAGLVASRGSCSCPSPDQHPLQHRRTRGLQVNDLSRPRRISPVLPARISADTQRSLSHDAQHARLRLDRVRLSLPYAHPASRQPPSDAAVRVRRGRLPRSACCLARSGIRRGRFVKNDRERRPELQAASAGAQTVVRRRRRSQPASARRAAGALRSGYRRRHPERAVEVWARERPSRADRRAQ